MYLISKIKTHNSIYTHKHTHIVSKFMYSYCKKYRHNCSSGDSKYYCNVEYSDLLNFIYSAIIMPLEETGHNDISQSHQHLNHGKYN